MDSFTDYTLAGNEMWRFFGLFIAILAGLLCGRIARTVFERKGKRIQELPRLKLAGLILSALARPVVLVFLLVGFKAGFLFLVMTDDLQGSVDAVLRILSAVTAGYVIYSLIDVADYYITQWAARTRNKIDDMLAPLVRRSLRLTMVVILGIFIAESLSGKPIGTLIAGLGVGALAVALAAQETIKNFFGSLVIMTDKPFQIGERVVIEGHDGPVEEVGFRSTKIRTLDGHLVTVPNSEIASRVIQNIGRRPYIKRVANITITYDTPSEKVERAVEIIEEILRDHEGMRPEFPPRVFFNEFNDVSLNILVIYWYHPPDYWKYMAFTEKVNKEIFRRFNEEGIEFAFPTQTIYLANDDKRQLALRLLNRDSGQSGGRADLR